MLADAFSFVGLFIGPLSKQQYIDALGGKLNPADGFPDLIGRQLGFAADPLEPGEIDPARARQFNLCAAAEDDAALLDERGFVNVRAIGRGSLELLLLCHQPCPDLTPVLNHVPCLGPVLRDLISTGPYWHGTV